MRRFGTMACPVVLSVLAAGCVPPYTRDLTTLNREQATHDLDYLVENLKAIHPDPFTRISEKAFAAHVSRVKGALGDATQRKDFSLVLAEVLAVLGDGHTGHHPYLDFGEYIRGGGKRFPLTLLYQNGAVMVVAWPKEVQPKRLKVGDTLEAINGNPMSAYLEKIGKYISVSGQKEVLRNWRLVRRFDVYLWHVEGGADSFEVTLRDAEGETYVERVSASWSKVVAGPKSKAGTARFAFHLDGQVCLFRVPRFFGMSAQEFEATVDDVFRQMKDKKTSVLIVDVRGNSGGNSGLAIGLLKRTADKGFKTGVKKWRYSKAYERAMVIGGLKLKGIPSWLLLDRWVRLHWWFPAPVDPSKLEGEYVPAQNGVVEPYKDHWDGTLVLVTDRGTASAATHFAVMVKDNELGLIAGEETGGPASGFTEVASLYLPNSGLSCQISSSHHLRPAGYDDGRGVLPDLPLDVTMEDGDLVETVYRQIKTE